MQKSESSEAVTNQAAKWVAVFAIAAAAPLLAASTSFTVIYESSLVDFARHFSIPVMLIELFVIIVGMMSGFGFLARLKAMGRTAMIALGALILIAFGTALAAYADPMSAYIRTLAWLLHLLLGLTLANMAKNASDDLDVSKISAAFLYGLLAWLAGLVIFVATLADPTKFAWLDMGYGVTNVRQLGFFGTAGFCLAIGAAITRADRSGRWFGIASATLFMTLIYWAAVRSAIFGIGLALVIGYTFVPVMRSVRAIGSIASAILAAIPLAILIGAPHSGMGFWRIFGPSPSDGPQKFTAGRWEVWKNTVSHIMEKPFFGHGESQYRLLVEANHQSYNHPHNVELQIAYQWGILGAACFFFLLWRLWRMSLGQAKGRPEEALAPFLVVTALFGFAQIEGAMYHVWPVMMMATCFALVAGHDGRETNHWR